MKNKKLKLPSPISTGDEYTPNYGKKGGITDEHIRKAVEYTSKNFPEKERGFKITLYCITNGTLVLDNNSPFVNLCSDKDCSSCRGIDKAFREEVNIMLFKPFDDGKVH